MSNEFVGFEERRTDDALVRRFYAAEKALDGDIHKDAPPGSAQAAYQDIIIELRRRGFHRTQFGWANIPPNAKCARTLGKSCRECYCFLPGEQGFIPCPEQAQGVHTPVVPPPIPLFASATWLVDRAGTELQPEPRTREAVAAVVLAERRALSTMVNTRQQSIAQGFTGNICTHCQSTRLRYSGTCEVCQDCGESGACS